MRLLSWLASIILATVVAGLVFVHISPDYNMHIVTSESMKPAVNMGDMIVTSPIDGPLSGEVRPGAIVTYERNKALVTHRVLSKDGDTLITKGDAVEDPDPRPVNVSQVRGIYLFKIPYVGYLFSFIRTRLGWFLMIFAPATLLEAFLIRDIVREALSCT